MLGSGQPYGKLLGKKDQSALFPLLDKVFRVRIEKNGKCYLRLEKGSPPTENPAIIPLQLEYLIN